MNSATSHSSNGQQLPSITGPQLKINRGKLTVLENILTVQTKSLIKEQFVALQQPLETSLKGTLQSKSPIAVVAQQGIYSAFTSCTLGTKSWIVDSGASNHMTRDLNVFSEIDLKSNGATLKIADGTYSAVTGIGFGLRKNDWQCKGSAGLYILETENFDIQVGKVSCTASSLVNDVILWHQRLGHPNSNFSDTN